MLVERWHLSSVWLTAKHINIITDIAYAMSCGNLAFVCALCTLFHVVSCLRAKMETVMELDDMQSRSYLGSYLDVLKGLQRIDECDEMEPLEKSKCEEGQVVSAFSKDLQDDNCNGTKPKFYQKESPADSGKTVKVLQELCEAAEAVNSGDSRKEWSGKESMLKALEKINATLEEPEDIKEAGSTDRSTVRDFFGVGSVGISDPSDHTPLLGEVVMFMYDVVKSQVSGETVADFAGKAMKLALTIGASLLVFPGNVLAAKLVDLGIQKLSGESAEALEDTIDRIATTAVGRALKLQALREAKIFVDYAEQQIHFHDSLDDGFAHLEGISDGVSSIRKNLSTLLAAETAFNRWLIIENALAASLHRLVPPERPDARRKEDLGGLQTVEERAEFFVVVVDNFLLYLLVLSKMAEKVQKEGPEHKLHNSLQERAREMAKLVLPSLAVMFEKQWGNPSVSMFYHSDPEYEQEVFLPNNTYCPQMPAAKCWWKDEPSWEKKALKKLQAFNSAKESEYKTLYTNNTEALATKLKGVLHNKLLYAQELQQSKWCSSFTDDPATFHHGARAAEFILKCLFYPLSDAVPVQEIMAFHSTNGYDRTGQWSFRHASKCASGHQKWLSVSTIAKSTFSSMFNRIGMRAVKASQSLVTATQSQAVEWWVKEIRRVASGNSSGVLECAKGHIITSLHIHTYPDSPLDISVGCGLVHGLHKIDNAGYTFSNTVREKELTFEVPCASDYAVLEKVEYDVESFKTTCRYAYFTKAECQKRQ